MTAKRNIFQVTSEDVIFLTSPYTFDPFIVQMFTVFAARARLVIVPDNLFLYLKQPTPSLMYHIGQELIQSKILSKDSSLRVLAFGGETCPTLSTLGKWRSLQSKTSIYNLYGITEVSCWASCHKITDCKLENGSGDLCENVTFRHRDLENYSAKEVNDYYNSKAAKKIQALEENKDSNITALSDVTELKTCFCSMQRQNQFNVCNICKHSTPSTDGVVASKAQTFSASQASVSASAVSREVAGSPLITKVPDQFFSSVQDHKGSMAVNPDRGNFNTAEGRVSVSCQWRTCLYKCIDASPLVVHAPGRSEGEVFIGSHSHVFMCIRLSDGKVLWESRLGDRIESSAALSLCGRYVIVGCYDGQVYVLNRFIGGIIWTFQTGAAVKSSPCIDPQTGLAWVGSHDHHWYVLDVTNRQYIAAIHCGGGSCFSSPCISKKPHLVFIATLTGCLLAIDATEHTVLWSQQCPKPVFASPLL
ncbi:acyl-CoA synthetase family member 4-like, partial [Stylophora pistillata]|uniref:acyl-CoA synthetase family member 4-like n=1 Tax=Stylophora pistillata TaxID=50429 RepID=UPI000C04F46B